MKVTDEEIEEISKHIKEIFDLKGRIEAVVSGRKTKHVEEALIMVVTETLMQTSATEEEAIDRAAFFTSQVITFIKSIAETEDFPWRTKGMLQ